MRPKVRTVHADRERGRGADRGGREARHVFLALAAISCFAAGCTDSIEQFERAYGQSTSADRRRELLLKLGSRRDPAGSSLAARALADPEPSVREVAALALGRLASAGSAEIDLLESALGDRDLRVRAAAARALGEIRDRSRAARLAQALGDSEATVRREAALALGRLGGATAVAGLRLAIGDPSAAVRSAALMALADLEGLAASGELSSALADPDADVRRLAAERLARAPPVEAAAALAQALLDPASGVARWAAEALVQLRSESAAAGLARAAAMFRDELRERACAALGEIPGDAARTALLELLRSPDDGLRTLAVRALGSGLHAAARDRLLKALEDSSPEVRREAAYALANHGSPEGAAILVGDLAAGERRARALDAIARAGEGCSAALEALASDRRARLDSRVLAMLALAEVGRPESARSVALALESANGELRSAAALALAELGSRADGPDRASTLEAVWRIVDDRDPRVRLCAAYAAARLGNESRLAELGWALVRGSSAESEMAARLLSRIASPRAAEMLLAGLRSREPLTRQLSALGLGRKGLDSAAVVSGLRACAGDPEGEVRASAARALGEIGTAESARALAAFALDRETAVAVEAVNAAARSRRREGAAIAARALDDPRLEVRAAAVQALAAITGASFGSAARWRSSSPVGGQVPRSLGLDDLEELRDAVARAQVWWLEHSKEYDESRRR